MLQYKFYNRLSEQKELLRSFENYILRSRKSLGYILRGRRGVGKTKLAEEFINKLQDVEILSEIPSFDSDKNIIRYACAEGENTPYQAFVKITEEIYNRSKLMDIFEKILKLGLAVFGINDALNAVNDLVKSIQSNKNEKSIARKEAKLFNTYRKFLKKRSKKSPLIIFIQNVQWIDAYSLKLIGKLLSERKDMWCMIMLEEDDEDIIESVHNNINQLIYDRRLFQLNVNVLDQTFPGKILSKTFGDDFFTAKELDLLYTISEGCPGKLISFIENKCIGEGWIKKSRGSWKKGEDFIEKIKPPKQKLTELIISLYEDKVILESEAKLIRKMARVWGLPDATVNATIEMIKDILSLDLNILYNLDWGIITKSSILVSDKNNHRYIVESISHAGLKRESEKISKRKVNHKNILEAHEIRIFENEILIIWDYFEEKKNRDGLLSEMERLLQNNTLKYTDLAIGLAALHHNDIYHGYIRPEAVIEKEPGKYQLATFDNSVLKYLLEQEKDDPERLKYYAPEYLSKKEWNCSGDVFSLGVLFYKSLTGNFPFYGKTPEDLLNSIKNDKVSFSGHLGSLIPDELKRIITRCLEFDPEERYPDATGLAEDLIKVKASIKSDKIKTGGADKLSKIAEGSPEPAVKTGHPGKKVLASSFYALIVLAGLFAVYWFFFHNKREKVVKKEIVINVEEKNLTENENRILDADLIKYLLTDEIMQSSDAIILTREQFKKIYHDNPEQEFVPSLDVQATIINHDFNYELVINRTDNASGQSEEKRVYDFTDPSELLISRNKEITKFILNKDTLFVSTFTNDWDAFSNFYKGEKAWAKIDVNNALRYYNKASSIDTGFVLAKLRLSEVYRFTGNNVKAMELLNSIMPGLDKLSKADSLKALATKNKIDGNYREAIKNMRIIVTYLKARKEPYYDLAEVYFELRDIENAKRNYEYALELDPDFVQAINHYAYCFSHTGEHDKALYYFRKYVRIDSSANAFDSYGDGLLAAGKLDSAAWAKKEGIRLDPNLDYLYTGLANVRMRQKNYDGAIKNIDTYISFQNSPEALATGYTDKAYIYFIRNDQKMALDTALKAKKYYDAFDLSTRNHKLHWLLAQIYLNTKQMKKFRKELAGMDTLIKKYDINASNYNEILKYNLHLKALERYTQNDEEKIMEIAGFFDTELWEKVKDWGSPFDPAFFYTEYGRMLMERPEEARKYLEKALRYNPHYSPAKEYLANLPVMKNESTPPQ